FHPSTALETPEENMAFYSCYSFESIQFFVDEFFQVGKIIDQHMHVKGGRTGHLVTAGHTRIIRQSLSHFHQRSRLAVHFKKSGYFFTDFFTVDDDCKTFND